MFRKPNAIVWRFSSATAEPGYWRGVGPPGRWGAGVLAPDRSGWGNRIEASSNQVSIAFISLRAHETRQAPAAGRTRPRDNGRTIADGRNPEATRCVGLVGVPKQHPPHLYGTRFAIRVASHGALAAPAAA